jgi:tetratricopeptide (TPR) repeat protein/predicted Ser/Thr protein kinase
MIGETLSHYRILEKLGEGGMGEVYLAEDMKLKRQVALKVLPSEMGEDPNRLERFQREAEAVAALDHPNIVTIYSVEEVDGTHFLTMSYIEGKSLGDVIPEKGMELEKLFRFAVPLADALSAAHEKGITHRDLKPANIMITPEGRVKVLDFGLAKLTEDARPPSEDEPTQALTREGLVVGTVPYMSPEQVQGDSVDHRTDIFSLGVLIYEMATGDRPFQGENSAQVVSSILRDDPPSVAERKADLPFHLSRIVKHCLEKDPKRRYQSALDLRNELEGLQSEVASGQLRPASSSTVIAAQPIEKRPKWMIPAIAGIILLALLVGWLAMGRRGGDTALPAAATGEATSEAPASPASRAAVAILYFDNLTGDEELDWLRTGLTDMLVTDLSQLSEVKVVGTDRVYQILKDMDMLEEPITSAEVVRQVAEKADAETVMLGSFAKAGETLRINVKVQDAKTGEILSTNRVEGLGGDNLFAMVDSLTSELRKDFDTGDAITVGGDRELMNVTTSSLEAYRHYAEGVHLEDQGRREEALAQLRRAVDIDPGFAMALRKLSAMLSNEGQYAESRELAQRAVDSADRLPLRERYLVEAFLYTSSVSTMNEGLAAYQKLLELEPDNTTAMNNLGLQFLILDLPDNALPLMERAIEVGTSFGGAYLNLATSQALLGRMGEAEATMEAFAARDPESWSYPFSRALIELNWGDPAEVIEFARRIDQLQPGELGSGPMPAWAYILLEDWQSARHRGEALAASDKLAEAIAGLQVLADLEWYSGQSEAAIADGRRVLDSYVAEDEARAGLLVDLAFDLLRVEEFSDALELFLMAAQVGSDSFAEVSALSGIAAARAEMGDFDQAREAVARRDRVVGELPGPWVARGRHHLLGRIALAEGDAAQAIAELELASAALPQHEFPVGYPVERRSHGGPEGYSTVLRFDLARAYLAAGEPGLAKQHLEAIVSNGAWRVELPVEYVRAFYFLGRIAEEQGDAAAARKSYQRYLDHWGDGDFDREQVDHARRVVGAS